MTILNALTISGLIILSTLVLGIVRVAIELNRRSDPYLIKSKRSSKKDFH